MKFTVEQRDEQLLNTIADIRYHISFEKSTQHLMSVKMEILNCVQSSIIVGMPVWIPGSYKVRDMNQHQGNVYCTDENNKQLTMNWLTKNRLEVSCPETATVNVHYLYYANDLGVRTSHVNRNHAFIVPAACLMFVEERMEEIHHLYFYHDRNKWKNITTSLSPTKPFFEENEPIVLGALSYHIVADSPVEIGNHEKRMFRVQNSEHEVAIISKHEINIDSLVDDIKKIVETQYVFWGELPYDRYVFILLVAEGQRGGLEHLRSNVSAAEPSAFQNPNSYIHVLGLLCHEFFHTWNIKRIRPFEYGPFDYNAENYSSMLWLAEGATSYFDDLLLYRAGLISKEEFLEIGVINNIRALERVQGRFVMSVKDSSYLAWIKLYSLSPDANNRFPSYYLKGGLIFLLLDLHIFIATNGEKRVDNVMLELWNMYKQNPIEGVTEQGFFNAITNSTGVDCSHTLQSWLNGTNELPYNEYFSRIGLEWKPLSQGTTDTHYGSTLSNDLFFGFSLKDDTNSVRITFVEDSSPAAIAGFGHDDIIISVNNTPVLNTQHALELLEQNGIEQPNEVIALCDGIEFHTELMPIQRVHNHLCIKNDATEAELSLFKLWLA